MKAYRRIKELQTYIANALLPEIKCRKVVLLDVPYYTNIGDTLIWQGTHDFLRQQGIKCMFTASKESFDFRALPKDYVILLQGGGNFGDIWEQHQLFRRRVIETYRDNKIIILPQTIFFEKEDNLLRDAHALARHPDLLIIGRDTNSYDILKKHYHANRVAMLPDMAFCIDFTKFKMPEAVGNRVLFFERRDVEMNHGYKYSTAVPPEAEVHEWPLMEKPDATWRTKWACRIENRLPRCYDAYWDMIMRPYYVNTGIQFIGRYTKVYTTRLHGAILSVLLDKDVVLFDNSYGKNSSFYNSWLKYIDNIKLV